MAGERYVGERRALRHFLTELRPLVTAALGENALLRYRIDRALRIGDLESLRAARETFHNQPDDLKRRLMRGIFEGPTDSRTEPGPRLAGLRDKPRAPVVRFEAHPAQRPQDLDLKVEIEHQPRADAPVRVLITPGTLPSMAAHSLREIAKWIEQDRRLLSSRHWQDKAASIGEEVAGDHPSRGRHPNDSADQA
jgi:hypothetical protein